MHHWIHEIKYKEPMLIKIYLIFSRSKIFWSKKIILSTLIQYKLYYLAISREQEVSLR